MADLSPPKKNPVAGDLPMQPGYTFYPEEPKKYRTTYQKPDEIGEETLEKSKITVVNPANIPTVNLSTTGLRKFILATVLMVAVMGAGVLFLSLKQPAQPQVNQVSSPGIGISISPSVTKLDLNRDTTISQGKRLTATGQVKLQNEVNSTQAFSVQDASGISLINVDTNARTISLGQPGDTVTLQIAGNVSINGNLLLNGNKDSIGPNGLVLDSLVVCTSAGCKPNTTSTDAVTLQGRGASYFTNASNINSGTLSDNRLSTNVALLNANQTFTGVNTFSQGANAACSSAQVLSQVTVQGGLVTGGSCSSGTGTLQQVYDASTPAIVKLSSASGGIVLQDASTPLGTDLFDVTDSSGATKYLSVKSSGVTAGGNLSINDTGSYAINFNGNGEAGNDTGFGHADGTIYVLTNGSRIATFTSGLGLGADPGGYMLHTYGRAYFDGASNSTTAFQIQNAGSTSNLFIADTTNNRIAIDQATANYPLDVNGDINTTGTFRISGTQIASSNLSDSSNLAKLNANQTFTGYNIFKPTTDSTTDFQVQNAAGNQFFGVDGVNNTLNLTRDIGSVVVGTSTNYGARLNISTKSTGVGGIIVKSASGQTADLLQLQDIDSASTPVLAVSAKGVTTIKNTTAGGSTTAFQVENSGGNALLAVDTQNSIVTLGNGSLNPTTVVKGNFLAAPTAGNDSTTAFQVQNSSGTSLLNIDTLNSMISIAPPHNGVISAWSQTMNSLPQAIKYQATASYNGYVYSVGGDNGSAISNVYYAKMYPDGTTGAWQSATSLPVAAEGNTAAAYNGYLYSLGGWNGSYISTVYYAKINSDGSIGSWNTTTALPYTNNGHSSFAYNGYIYMIGGYNGTFKSASYYAALNGDGTIGSWTVTSALPVAIDGQAVAVANGYAYIVGGNSGSIVNTVYYSKINAGGTLAAWSTGSALPKNIYNQMAAYVNGYLYSIGGCTQANCPAGYAISDVYKAIVNSDGSIGAWTATTPLPKEIMGHVTVTYNNYMYVIGGSDIGSNRLSSVYSGSINSQLFVADNANSQIRVGSVVGTSPSIVNTVTNTTVTQTNSNYSYSVLGSDGYGRIVANYSSGGVTLRVCQNDDCSSSVSRGIDGNSGFIPSMVAVTTGSDGKQRLAFWNSGLKFAVCADVTCTSSTLTTIGGATQASSIAIAMAPDGFARIAYGYNGGNLTYLQCTDANCTTPVTTVIEADNGNGVSMVIGPDGFARIVHSTNFIQCTNAACSTSVITGISSGLYGQGSLALGSDGFARIALNGSAAYYEQCTNAACSTRNLNLVSPTGIGSNSIVAVALDTSNNGHLVYKNSSNQLVLVTCTNASCSTYKSATNTGATPAAAVGIGLASDGYPRVYSGYSGAGVYSHYYSVDGIQENISGSSLGSSSNYLGSLYVRNINATNGININNSGRSSQLYAVDVSGGGNYYRGLNASGSTTYSVTDSNFLFSSTTNSTTAFQVQNSSGTNVFNVDTTNGRVGIGTTTTPSAVLQVQSAAATNLFQVTDSTAGGPGTINVMTIADEGATTFRNRTDSSAAFQIQNAAGTNLFVGSTTNMQVSTQSLLGLTAASVYSNSFTTLASNLFGNYGGDSAIATGQDGYSRIVFFNQASNSLEFIQCTNLSCSSFNRNVVDSTLSSFGGYDGKPAIAIGTDGYARLAYYNGASIKFAECTNATCSTSSITTIDSGNYPSITMGNDGFPRVSYYNAGLKFAQCTNAACTTPTLTLIDSTGTVGQYSSIAVASDGFARISYYDATNGDLKFAQCTNAACSTRNLTSVDTVGVVGQFTSLALGSDGFARISYYDSTNGHLKFVQCTNTACTTSNVATVDSASGVGTYSSVVLGSDGFAKIAYYDATNTQLKYASCSNAACTVNNIVANIAGTSPVGQFASISIGGDGTPRIVYMDHRFANGAVGYGRLASNDGISSGVTGTSVGTTSSPFSQLNALQLNLQGGANYSTINITGGSPSSGSYFKASDSNGLQNINLSSTGFSFRPSTDSTSAFQVQNAAGTNTIQVDSTNGRLAVGNIFETPTAPLEVEGPLQDTVALPYNIKAFDTAAAAQGVGGGIGFGGYADTTRMFGVIQGYHESATASNYAGALAFYTRQNGAGGVSKVLNLSSTGAATFTNSADSASAFQIQNSTGGNLLNADTSNSQISTTNSNGTSYSDEFNTGGPSAAAKWTFTTPDTSSYTVNSGIAGELDIVPSTSSSLDCWTASQNCLRLMQTAPSGNFEADTKINTAPPNANNRQGILVWKDTANFIRFEYDGSASMYVHKVIGGVGTSNVESCAAFAAPIYMRVLRNGDNWTLQYSANGSNYFNCGGTFTQALDLSGAGAQIGLHITKVDTVAWAGADFDYFHVYVPTVNITGGISIDSSNSEQATPFQIQTGGESLVSLTEHDSNWNLDAKAAATFHNSTDSTTAFQIQNASGANLFNADTSGSMVTVGSDTVGGSVAKLNVLGGLYSPVNGYKFNLKADDTSAAAQGVGGGIGFGGQADVDRTFAVIQGYHESATASDYAGALGFYTRESGAAGLTKVMNLSSIGAATFQNSADSSLAFQVQDTGSNALLAVDTQNSIITLGSGALNPTTVIKGNFLAAPTAGHDSATAFQVQNAGGTSLFTADTSTMAITINGALNVTGTLTLGSTPTTADNSLKAATTAYVDRTIPTVTTQSFTDSGSTDFWPGGYGVGNGGMWVAQVYDTTNAAYLGYCQFLISINTANGNREITVPANGLVTPSSNNFALSCAVSNDNTTTGTLHIATGAASGHTINVYYRRMLPTDF